MIWFSALLKVIKMLEVQKKKVKLSITFQNMSLELSISRSIERK